MLFFRTLEHQISILEDNDQVKHLFYIVIVSQYCCFYCISTTIKKSFSPQTLEQ